MTKNKINLSPSSIQSFFSGGCPAAWNYSRTLEPIAKEKYFEVGTLVHSMMDGSTDPTIVEDKLAFLYYKKLLEIKAERGISIIKSEIWRVIELNKHINLRMRIDALALIKTRELIIDWKTSGGGWKTIQTKDHEVSPNAMSFQAASYLIADSKDWPKEMAFVVAPIKGAPRMFFYYQNDEDYRNLVEAAEMVYNAVKANTFPKVRGYACNECKFQSACYESPNWKADYKPRVTSSK